MGKPMRSLLNSFRRFCSGRASRAGNVAITFSIAVIPIIGGVGAAVDYSMANNNRSSMQKALDATALTLAKQMPMSQADLDSKGWQFFAANLGVLKVNVPQAGLVITQPVTGKLHLVATGSYTPQISGFIGIKTFPVAVNTTVQWGMKKLELALALDNTGSMRDDNKMTELKKAAKSLLTTLKNTAQIPGDIKVAIIPFNTVVNTGENTSTAWIKKGDWDIKEGHCDKKDWWGNPYYPKATCESNGGGWHPTPYNNGHFKGCVEDRNKDTNVNHDARDTAPTNGATRFPARTCPGGLTTLLPLTYDWTALNNKIDDMDSDGSTNVTIGLAWAWHALTPGLPLTQAAAASTDLNKIIILMTDGENTQNRWNGTGYSHCPECDVRTALACTNVKAAGIQVYTIRVIEGNATLLRNCATDPSMYYDVQNASQLTSVFNSIGSTLAKLHLSE
jgi:Flp pilus assembly protein TadG